MSGAIEPAASARIRQTFTISDLEWLWLYDQAVAFEEARRDFERNFGLLNEARQQADQFRAASDHYATVVIPEYGAEVTRLRAEVAEARRALENALDALGLATEYDGEDARAMAIAVMARVRAAFAPQEREGEGS